MIQQFLIFFGSMAVLFFLVSLLTKARFWYLTIILNIAFLAMLLFSYTQFLGTALPFQYNIPFWKFQEFNAQNLVMVKVAYADDNLIHFLIEKNKGQVKYITLKNTPELLAKLQKAIKERNGFGFMMMLDTDYPGGTESNFPDKDLQKNTNQPKDLPSDEGIEEHDATGDGHQTN